MTFTRLPARRSTVACAVMAGALLLAPAPAARAEGLSNEQRAEQLFRAGEKKFDAGQHAEACLDFEASLKLGPKLGTLLNVALCHETIGKVATAWREFQHASAWAALNNQRDRHEFAVQHVLALEPRLPRILLQLPVDRAMATLEVDGEPLPEQRWNLPLYLDPGEHAVAVNAPGKHRASVTFRVTMSPTEQIVVVPSLADDGPAAPEPSAARPAEPDHRVARTVGYGLLAGGGAAVLTGVVLGTLSLVKRGDADARCPGATACDAEGADLWKGAGALGTGAFVGLTAGVVLAGAGGVLLWTSRAPEASAKKAGILLGPARLGAGLGLSGAF